MCWIKELYVKAGSPVECVSQKGHEHWGFEVGGVYQIVERGGSWGFLGVGRYEGSLCSPGSNYAWGFLPTSLEND